MKDSNYDFTDDFRVRLKKVFDEACKKISNKDIRMIGFLPVDTARERSDEYALLSYFDDKFHEFRHKDKKGRGSIKRGNPLIESHAKGELQKLIVVENDNVTISSSTPLFSTFFQKVRPNKISKRFFLIRKKRSQNGGDRKIEVIAISGKKEKEISVREIREYLCDQKVYDDVAVDGMYETQLAGMRDIDCTFYYSVFTTPADSKLSGGSVLYTIVGVVANKENKSRYIARIIENVEKKLISVSWMLLRQALSSYHHRLMKESLRTAVGSIMSRNGSHNIGSHVLAALSYNVGTMPDDRELYQYVQHRMDYIATVTTDFPTWIVPTRVVGEIMRTFYAQKHLLDYISRSEGLCAYKYRDRNFDDVQYWKQKGRIRIFVRKIFDTSKSEINEKLKNLKQNILYMYTSPRGKSRAVHHFWGESVDELAKGRSGMLDAKYTPQWNHDVRIAIPGGVIGRHAFYTIIENVIRNAAKHGWVKKLGVVERDGETEDRQPENLNVYVDFEELSDSVSFTVGDNVSDVYGEAKNFWLDFFKTINKFAILEEITKDSVPEWEITNWWNDHTEGQKVSPNRDPEFERHFQEVCLSFLTPPEARDLTYYIDGSGETLPVLYRIVKAYLPRYKSKNTNDEIKVVKDIVLLLHHDMHRRLEQPFISVSGTLRQGNWGLAEMKISAGFLGQRAFDEIVGLTQGKSTNENTSIITPIAMFDVYHYSYEEHSQARFLGYRFTVKKPKEVLIVFTNGEVVKQFESDSEARNIINGLKHEGIHFAKYDASKGNERKCRLFLSPQELEELTSFNYRYVVFIVSEGNNSNLDPNFCFRQVTMEYGKFKEALGDGELSNAQASGKKDLYEKVCKLKKLVFSAWLGKLMKERGDLANTKISFQLNVAETNEGSGRGLVTSRDVMGTMFKECYHTALIAFLENPPDSIELSDTSRHLIMLLSLIQVNPEELRHVPQDVDYSSGGEVKKCIRAQLSEYCDLLKKHLFLSTAFVNALQEITRYFRGEMIEVDGGVESILRIIGQLDNRLEASIATQLFYSKTDENESVRSGCEQLTRFLINVGKADLDDGLDAFCGNRNEGGDAVKRCPRKTLGHGFAQTIKAVLDACSIPEEEEFDALVESLNSMFFASDVYLRKYEERIATLPGGYKRMASKGGQSESALATVVDDLVNNKDRSGETKIVKYSRHDSFVPKNAIYAEALSGSQSYLSLLAQIMVDPHESSSVDRVARLLEAAFLRILIIDERVANFLKDHDEMNEIFVNMGIFVADVDGSARSRGNGRLPVAFRSIEHRQLDEESRNQVLEFDKEEQTGRKFDILVIHQGIIDKWWGKPDEITVENVLEKIRASGGTPEWRVVVTTGRGRPDNIPSGTKVLPFSCIEASLFKRYPEKMVLVNTILNLLPYGDSSEASA